MREKLTALTTAKYWNWFVFAGWFTILAVMMIVLREFFWVALPGVVTYFAKAIDLI